MKKLFAFLVMTTFLGVVILGGAYVIAGSADPKIAVINKGVNNKNTVDYLDEDDLASDSDGAVASQQSIKDYVDNDEGRISRIVVIYDMDQLSTWAGNNIDTAGSGSSYYQMESGKTYIVDAIALKLDNPTQSYATIGGVTLHMPLAASTNDLQEVSVLYAQRDSGTSATPCAFDVYVFPAPLAGTTTWYVGATGGPTVGRQNMTGMATSGSSTITTASEGPMATLNTVGEMATWILMNDSATSAVMKAWLGNMP